MLCSNCSYRDVVVSSEVGTVFDRCSEFKVEIATLGNVEKCSSYSAKDLPYLFAQSAWTVQKNEDTGEIEILSPAELARRWQAK